MVTYSYDIPLVLAAVLVSFMAAFTGLTLTSGISSLGVATRKTLVVMSALVLGGGIWSMHFVAMLAMRFPVPIFYDVRSTLASALIAILLAGLALLILHFRPRTRRNMAIAGTVLGTGIISMHFLGMSGITGCRPVYGALGIVVSAAVAVTMGIIAVGTAYGRRTKQNIFIGALVFGLSVVIVHFTAMYWTGFVVFPADEPVAPALENATLAIIIMLAAFLICGTFLLSAITFLSPATAAPADDLAPVGPPIDGLDIQRPAPNTEPRAAVISKDAAKDGSPAMPATKSTPEHPSDRQAVRVPYERNGRTHFMPSADIAAIRAEGHYTYLYAGDEKLFCPWSISDAETRLAGTGFHRSHRSYLVNIDHVSGFERRKDNGACLLEGFGQLKTVPVSRSRIDPLRAALGL